MDDYFYKDERWDNKRWEQDTWSRKSKSIFDHTIAGYLLLGTEWALLIIGILFFIPKLVAFSLFMFFVVNVILLIINSIQSYNILKMADDYNIPDSNKRVIKAKTDLATAIVGFIFASKKIINTSKDSINYIADPDKWNKI